MIIALTIVLCLLTITFHELGHAYAMRKCGVSIKKIGLLGIPIKWVPYLNKEILFFGQLTRFEIHPLIIGAFVEPEEEGIKALSMRDRVYIFGMGPLASMLIGAILLTIAGTATKSFSIAGFQINLLLWMPVAIVFMIVFARQCCQYIIPFLGIVLMGNLLLSLATHPETDVIGGPVTVVNTVTELYQRLADMGIFVAPFIAGLISILIGLTNMLPLVPLDGGLILHAYLNALHAKIGHWFMRVGFALFIGIIILALSSDFKILIR
ncbi:MAG: site-2 protease family protein [Parcubacteria group bacterium]|nr:site-2 protease family protein [Parcubacteria group bacterium]